MEELKKLITNNIVKYRKMANLTQEQLAERLNYSSKSVSKWERGDSLPDIVVLKHMANIFGISLDSLTSEQTEKPKIFIRLINKIYTNKFLVSSCATLIVWLIATITFVCLTLFTAIEKNWLAFIYAIPVNFIVLICLTKSWKSVWYNFLTVSGLIISIPLCISLTITMKEIVILYVVCIPLIALAFLWFVMRKKIFKRFAKSTK